MLPDLPEENSEQRGDELQVPEELRHLRAVPRTFKDESLAPEVDRNVLLALVRGELPEEQARLVYDLIYSFKSWNDVHTEILVEEFRQRPK